MPLVPAAEDALRRALVESRWRVRHAAAEALYAAGVARRAAVAVLLAGPRGEPGSAVEEAFSLDPLPPEILADLWAIAWQVAGVAVEPPRLVRVDIHGARRRIRRLGRRRLPAPAGLCDALWARAIEPGDVPDRDLVHSFYAAVMSQDPAAGARLVGLLDHADADRAAWSFGLLRCRGTLPVSPPELWRWLDAGLRDPGRHDRAFDLLDAIRGWLPVEQLRAAAGERFADALLAARAVPAPEHRATVIGVLAGWERERADVRAAVSAALDDPSPTVRHQAAHGRVAWEEPHWPPAARGVRERHIEALMASGAPALEEHLASRRGRDISHALLAIERLGEAAAAVTPAIVALLGRAMWARLRLRAARALGAIGPAARDAVPTLVALLGDPDEVMGAAAARSLGRVGAVGSLS